jgi:hypothetical protein
MQELPPAVEAALRDARLPGGDVVRCCGGIADHTHTSCGAQGWSRWAGLAVRSALQNGGNPP